MSSHTATSARKSQPPEASRHQEESEEEEEEEEAEVPVPTANCVLENTLGSPSRASLGEIVSYQPRAAVRRPFRAGGVNSGPK